MTRPAPPASDAGSDAAGPGEDLAAAGPEVLAEELRRATVLAAAVGRRRAELARAALAAGLPRLEVLQAARLPGRQPDGPPCEGCGTVQAPRAPVRRRAVPDGRPVVEVLCVACVVALVAAVDVRARRCAGCRDLTRRAERRALGRLGVAVEPLPGPLAPHQPDCDLPL